LLPAILDIARDVGARWLFLENVRGILSAGHGAAYGEILRTLADFGWNAEWTVIAAQWVGASHKRERWFCVAYRDTRRRGDSASANASSELENPESKRGQCRRLANKQIRPGESICNPQRSGEIMADADARESGRKRSER